MSNMPDLSQVDWAKLITISFTIVPVVYKYRAALRKVTDVLAEAIGFTALVGGLYMYTRVFPEVHMASAQLRADSSVTLADYVRTLDLLYFGSIGLMVLGGLVSVFGLIGRLEAALRDRLKPPPPPSPKRR